MFSQHEWYLKNKEAVKLRVKIWKAEHPNKVKASKLKWSRKPQAKEKQRVRFAIWYKNHRR